MDERRLVELAFPLASPEEPAAQLLGKALARVGDAAPSRWLKAAREQADVARENGHSSSQDSATLYVARACGEWASEAALPTARRNAALAALVVLASGVSPNLRWAMGVDADLEGAALCEALEPRLRGIAAALAAGDPPPRPRLLELVGAVLREEPSAGRVGA